MFSAVDRLTREVRKHDRDLFAQVWGETTWIMRRAYRYETYLIDDLAITFSLAAGQKILPLTEGWKPQNTPVPWGILPVIRRLKQIDSHNNDHFREIEIQNEKVKRSQQRDFHNKIESFFYDSRPAFKKQFAGINTSTMKK